jgi:hypothetical protein
VADKGSLSNRIVASRFGPAHPGDVAWNGADDWLIFSQARQGARRSAKRQSVQWTV